MKKNLNILHIEDDEKDVLLILRELHTYWPEINHFRVEKMSELQEAMKQKWDIILSDYQLPEFDGLTALSLVHDYGIDTPFIMVSGKVDEDVAILVMRLGAADYVMKDKLQRLVPAISRELKRVEDRGQANP